MDADLEPGPFADAAPWTPLAWPIRPGQFVQLLAPYANLLDGAHAAIDALHQDMVSTPGFDNWEGLTPPVTAAAAALGAIAARDDTAALAPFLLAVDAVRGAWQTQLLDLPGPDDTDLVPEPNPGPPPGWDKDFLPPTPSPGPITPTPPAPSPAPAPAPTPPPTPSPEPTPAPTPAPTPEPTPEPTGGGVDGGGAGRGGKAV